MTNVKDILKTFTQHEKVLLRVSSHKSEPLPKNIYQQLAKPHRKPHYFFLFMVKGKTTHVVDLQKITITDGQLLFVLPHQIHILPPNNKGNEYFKLGCDKFCLSLLPKQFLFLINPLNSQVVSFDKKVQLRVKTIFEMLAQLLQTKNEDVELLLAHLNTLMAECNQAYFKHNRKDEAATNSISKFIAFKLLVESELTEQNSVQEVAGKLALTSNGLYNIVKSHTGLSPKEFITNRLMLEAQRKLYYSETSVKELAYELGFTDPAYFSKLFKKHTGKSITEFVERAQDLSGN